nr:hypothetical protein [uncultured Rhodopila sp.]
MQEINAWANELPRILYWVKDTLRPKRPEDLTATCSTTTRQAADRGRRLPKR